MLISLLVISIAVGIGIELNDLLASFGIKLPMFVTSLFAGIFLTNTIPYIFKQIPWPTNTPTLALVSDLSLGLFLAMSLMSLQLWSLADLALPLILVLVMQVLFTVFFYLCSI